MIQNQAVYHVFFSDHDDSDISQEEIAPRFQATNALPIPWVPPGDISNLVVFLASDEGRYLTGAVLPLDSGFSVA
jgi:NAD(P)-dependent dehydrogenase (short-subunit alcohol dehydrogenase family)